MSLLLCRQEPVKFPYAVDELGIRLYSSQELCYVIFNNPLLAMDGFICSRLADFVRDELKMPMLAEKIARVVEGGGAVDELLFQILADCAYYSPQEQAKFRQEVSTLRRLPPEEFAKRRADHFYNLGLYGRAAAMYGRLLDALKGKEGQRELKGRDPSGEKKGKGGSGEHKDRNSVAALRGRIWNNIAACHAGMFRYGKAMAAYERAMEESPETEYLKRMYFLTAVDPGLKIKERFLPMIGDGERAAWDGELLAAREAISRDSGDDALATREAVPQDSGNDAQDPPEILPGDSGEKPETARGAGSGGPDGRELENIEGIFAKDPVKRINEAGALLDRWKAEYRMMV